MTKKKIRPSDVSVAVELFELGAAWQKERMYSRDDISVLIKDFIQFYTNRPEGSKKLSGVGQWLIDHKLEDK